MYSKLFKFYWFFICFLLIVPFSCEQNIEANYTVSVTNDSDISRSKESIEIWFNQLELNSNASREFKVLNESGNIILSQNVDVDADSIYDYIVFQTSIEAKASKTFNLANTQPTDVKAETTHYTYCKSVPERMDDFAWENDVVAFRTYGPECQRLFEAGTLLG